MRLASTAWHWEDPGAHSSKRRPECKERAERIDHWGSWEPNRGACCVTSTAGDWLQRAVQWVWNIHYLSHVRTSKCPSRNFNETNKFASKLPSSMSAKLVYLASPRASKQLAMSSVTVSVPAPPSELRRQKVNGVLHLYPPPSASSSRFHEDRPFVHQVSHVTKSPTSNVMGQEWRFPEGFSWCDALVADETGPGTPSPETYMVGTSGATKHYMGIAALPRNHSYRPRTNIFLINTDIRCLYVGRTTSSQSNHRR